MFEKVVIVWSPPPHFDVQGSGGGSLPPLPPSPWFLGNDSRGWTSRASETSGTENHAEPTWQEVGIGTGLPSYQDSFISVWTCGPGPNPGRSGRPRCQPRGQGVVVARRNLGSPAVLRSSYKHSWTPVSSCGHRPFLRLLPTTLQSDPEPPLRVQLTLIHTKGQQLRVIPEPLFLSVTNQTFDSSHSWTDSTPAAAASGSDSPSLHLNNNYNNNNYYFVAVVIIIIIIFYVSLYLNNK